MIEKSTSGNEAFYDATDDSCIIKHGSKYNFNTDIIINSVFSIVLKRGQHKGHHPSSMFISSELSGQDVSRFAKYSVDHGTFCCYFHWLGRLGEGIPKRGIFISVSQLPSSQQTWTEQG